MAAPLYSISLLNDLHQWFPDILYNPGRFRTVQDLLEYIRQVADVNPFTRGLEQYHAHHSRDSRDSHVSVHSAPTSASIPSVLRRQTTNEPSSLPLRESPSFEYSTTTNIHGNPVTAVIRTIPVAISAEMMEGEEMDSMAEQTISTILNQLLSNPNMRNFLQENVVVAPSNEQIHQASSLETATETLEDNCAICQDSMEESQSLRRLLHCRHVFHQTCIDTWFRTNVHCPTCRHDVRELESSSHPPPPVPDNHRRTNIRRNDS
jgi:hypothetical protein